MIDDEGMRFTARGQPATLKGTWNAVWNTAVHGPPVFFGQLSGKQVKPYRERDGLPSVIEIPFNDAAQIDGTEAIIYWDPASENAPEGVTTVPW